MRWPADAIANAVDRGCLHARDVGHQGRHFVAGAARGAVAWKLRQSRGLPARIVIDNGTEFTSKVLDQWAYENKIGLHFITPGRPIENGYIESYYGKFREECLNGHWFLTLDDARENIEAGGAITTRYARTAPWLPDSGGVRYRPAGC